MKQITLVICMILSVNSIIITAQNLKRKSIQGKYGYVDVNGKTIIDPEFEDAALEFSEGLACIKMKDKWGFIDLSGKKVISCKYEEVWYFHEGLAKAKLLGKWGYIDKKGKTVIPFVYDYGGNFEKGTASAQLNDKYGLIDNRGNELISFKYDAIRMDAKTGIAQVKLSGKWGFADQSGKEIIPCIYESVFDFYEGLTHVKLNNKYGYIDITGNVIIPIKYDDAWTFSNGEARVKLNGREFYINKKGEESRVDLSRSDQFGSDTETHVLAVIPFEDIHKKWGLKGADGIIILQPKYQRIFEFSEGFAVVQNDKLQRGYINSKGLEITPLKYQSRNNFSGGIAVVSPFPNNTGAENKFGIIDASGKEIANLIYDQIENLSNGYAKVLIEGKWGFVDKSGNQIVSPKYDVIGSFSEGMAMVSVDGKWGFINTEGKENVNPQYSMVSNFQNGLADVYYSKDSKDYTKKIDINGNLKSQEVLIKKEEMTPYEVVKLVSSGSIEDLFVYCQKFGFTYTKGTFQGFDDYEAKGIFEVGPTSILSSKNDKKFSVTYKFKDKAQRDKFLSKLIEEGFEKKEGSKVSYDVTKNGVDVWFYFDQVICAIKN